MGFFAGGEFIGWLAIKEVGARGGFIEEAEDIEEGSLAAAGGAHNHDELAALDSEGEILEGETSSGAETVTLGDILQFNNSGGILAWHNSLIIGRIFLKKKS